MSERAGFFASEDAALEVAVIRRLIELEGSPALRPLCERFLMEAFNLHAETPIVTAGVADALEGIASALAEAAEHFGHLVSHARITASPRRPRRP